MAFDGYVLSHGDEGGHIVLKYQSEDEFYYLVGKLTRSRNSSLKKLAEKYIEELKEIKKIKLEAQKEPGGKK